MLNIDLESGGGAIIARLSGELDRSAREPLLKAVRTEAENQGGKVVLDCGNLSTLDSEGVRALLALQTWLRIKDSEMAIAALPPKLEETIRSDSGVDHFLARHPSVPAALQSLGLSAPPPPAAPPSTSPVSAPPPAAPASPPASPATPESSGGWGPPISPTPADPPGAPPASKPPGPWDSPIETPPPPVSSSPTPPPTDESEVPPPPGAWGAPPATPVPATVATSTSPPVDPPTPWAKGPPPPTSPTAPKKSKLSLIIGAAALALVVALVLWKVLSPSPVTEPASLRPQEYVLRGTVGQPPSRNEVAFSLTNVDLTSIRTAPAALPDWITLTTQGSESSAEVTLQFDTISALPSADAEQGFLVEATGLDGQALTGLVHFQIREPNILTFEQTSPRPGEVGQRYSDFIQVKGEGATFTTDTSQLPPGIELAPDGKLSGNPQSAGEFTFTVTATREDDQPAEETFTLTIAPQKAPETNSEEVAELIRMILERIGNLDIASMSKDVRRQYERLVAYLGQILADPVNHVKPAVTVTFPVGRVTLDADDVIAQLENAGLEDWLANRDTQFIIAGFADTSGDPEKNRTLIELRAKNLESVIEDWLVRIHREPQATAEERVTVVPNKPSDVFQKSRAAECWIFRPPAG